MSTRTMKCEHSDPLCDACKAVLYADHPQPVVGDDELRSRILCITGECPAEHDGCVYDPSDEVHDNGNQIPQTNKLMSLVQAHTEAAVREARLDEVEGFIGLDLLGTLRRIENTHDYIQRRKARLTKGGN